jgi:hypothetical protein
MPRSPALFLVALTLAACAAPPRPKPQAPKPRPTRPQTVEAVVAQLGTNAELRLGPFFQQARLPYPPRRVHLLAFKQERRLELWADSGGAPAFVRSYPLLAASGGGGPKLLEGDLQVPEGIYRVVALNPLSSYHLSMKLDYPNAFDREKAAAEGRTRPGSDIFIHGKDVSEGCLAVGDRSIEDLFVLVARVGLPNVRVLIAPNDLRRAKPPSQLKVRPTWLPELYGALAAELRRFRAR